MFFKNRCLAKGCVIMKLVKVIEKTQGFLDRRCVLNTFFTKQMLVATLLQILLIESIFYKKTD